MGERKGERPGFERDRKKERESEANVVERETGIGEREKR